MIGWSPVPRVMVRLPEPFHQALLARHNNAPVLLEERITKPASGVAHRRLDVLQCP